MKSNHHYCYFFFFLYRSLRLNQYLGPYTASRHNYHWGSFYRQGRFLESFDVCLKVSDIHLTLIQVKIMVIPNMVQFESFKSVTWLVKKWKIDHRFIILSFFKKILFYLFIYFSFICISWRLITLQCCSGFCHTLTWISHGFTCVPHPEPPSPSFPIPSLWVIPVHQPWAPASCIQPGLAICFTIDNIHVSMLFSQTIPPSPSCTESKSLFYTSVTLFLSCI